MSATELLDDAGAATALKVSRGTLANWRSTGTEGPKFVKIGRLVRYRAADLEAYVTARTLDPSRGQVARG